MNIKESFARVGFSPEEKLALAARLERAAEQEENMTGKTTRSIRKISGGVVFGIAAAVVMTVGALAAALSPGLRTWFDLGTPGAPETLERGIYDLGLTQTYNGWTMSLGECVGDDSMVYIWMDLTAPEGRVLALPEGGYFNNSFGFHFTENHGCGADLVVLPDDDPADNKMSFLLKNDYWAEGFRGKTVDISVSPFVDCWWTGFGTEDAQYHEGSPMTDGIREHTWLFEDVTLDYPDQTIRLEPGAELSCLGGTTVLTKLEVSPLSVSFTLEGGSCTGFLDRLDRLYPKAPAPADEDGAPVHLTVVSPDPDILAELKKMEASLTVEVALRDGTTLTPATTSLRDQDRREGPEGEQIPFLRRSLRYDDVDVAEAGELDLPTRVLDPAQVACITVCGVDIPVNPAA